MVIFTKHAYQIALIALLFLTTLSCNKQEQMMNCIERNETSISDMKKLIKINKNNGKIPIIITIATNSTDDASDPVTEIKKAQHIFLESIQHMKLDDVKTFEFTPQLSMLVNNEQLALLIENPAICAIFEDKPEQTFNTGGFNTLN